MKARVKETGVIVEISLSHIVYDNGKKIIWYNTPRGASFSKEELEFIDTGESLDYWTRLEHQYAGMAMQGILANYGVEPLPDDAANDAREYAHALVETLKG